jgi:hypothetical protein
MIKNKYIGKVYKNKLYALKTAKKHNLSVERIYTHEINYRFNKAYRSYRYILKDGA